MLKGTTRVAAALLLCTAAVVALPIGGAAADGPLEYDAEVTYLDPLPWDVTDTTRRFPYALVTTNVLFETVDEMCVTAFFEGDLLDEFESFAVEVPQGMGIGWYVPEGESADVIERCTTWEALIETLADGSEIFEIRTEPDWPAAAQSSFRLTGLEVTLTGSPHALDCTVEGTEGDDVLVGTSGDDVICGYGGADNIQGFGGDDLLLGGPGKDVISGGEGDDIIDGGEGGDQIFGGDGADSIFGGPGWDRLHGGVGADHFRGDSENDRMYGNAGRDQLFGGTGTDTLYGGSTDLQDGDRIFGQSARDRLYGGSGLDQLFGGSGDDGLWGGDHPDTLNGGTGDDWICGQADVDVIEASPGDDSFCAWDRDDM